jgi:uncharacterized membrane protein
MNNLNKRITKEGLPLTYGMFYTVGLILYFIPATRSLFIHIIPYTIILVATPVFVYHKDWNIKTLLVLISIFTISMLIEIGGVASGKLFGVYAYSTSLGVKIWNVPLVIGLNWVILVYGSHAILSKFTSNSWLRILGASVLMIVYDLVLEQIAPVLNMWIFESKDPPLRNYLMWLILSILFQSIIEIFSVNTDNRPARALFILQTAFFSILILFSKFYIQ